MDRSDDGSCCLVVAQPKGTSFLRLLLYLVIFRLFQVGERRVLFIYALLAIGLELVVWFVPSLIGGAVSVAIIGVLLGPMYSITMNHAGRVLPAWLLTGIVPCRISATKMRVLTQCMGRFDWMDRWFRSSGVSVVTFYDGRDRVQVGYQFLAAFVSVIVSVGRAGASYASCLG